MCMSPLCFPSLPSQPGQCVCLLSVPLPFLLNLANVYVSSLFPFLSFSTWPMCMSPLCFPSLPSQPGQCVCLLSISLPFLLNLVNVYVSFSLFPFPFFSTWPMCMSPSLCSPSFPSQPGQCVCLLSVSLPFPLNLANVYVSSLFPFLSFSTWPMCMSPLCFPSFPFQPGQCVCLLSVPLPFLLNLANVYVSSLFPFPSLSTWPMCMSPLCFPSLPSQPGQCVCLLSVSLPFPLNLANVYVSFSLFPFPSFPMCTDIVTEYLVHNN